jgi:hypothetical protein
MLALTLFLANIIGVNDDNDANLDDRPSQDGLDARCVIRVS